MEEIKRPSGEGVMIILGYIYNILSIIEYPITIAQLWQGENFTDGYITPMFTMLAIFFVIWEFNILNNLRKFKLVALQNLKFLCLFYISLCFACLIELYVSGSVNPELVLAYYFTLFLNFFVFIYWSGSRHRKYFRYISRKETIGN